MREEGNRQEATGNRVISSLLPVAYSLLPFLQAIAWQIRDIHSLTDEEIIRTYERNWRHRTTFANLADLELAFIIELAKKYNSWLAGEVGVFNFSWHRRILTLLNALDVTVLQNAHACFAGGTLLSLEYGEYRLSKDVDFLFPASSECYRYLRSLVHDDGVEALFHNTDEIEIGSFTSDQYGVRFAARVDGESIKVEFVANASFELDLPIYPTWCNIPALSISDRFTSKLMANADRWNNASTFSRDLIDLAMLRYFHSIPDAAIAKVNAAYTDAIISLCRAIAAFAGRRESCYYMLQIPAEKIDRIEQGLIYLLGDFCE